MASTNHTTNYNLSQFIGTDKPAWLSDYNGDMGKIDTAVKNAADTATGADGKADANATKIGTLTSLTTTVKTDLVSAINEVDSNADTAQGTANQASLDASAAAATANSAMTAINKFNLTSFKTYDSTNITASGGSVNGGSWTLAKDASGSIFKLYGNLNTRANTTGQVKFTLPATGIAPDTEFTIVGCGLYTQDSVYNISSPSITVKTNGTMEVSTYMNNNTTGVIRLMACLYFAKDFGDTPE